MDYLGLSWTKDTYDPDELAFWWTSDWAISASPCDMSVDLL